MAPHWLSRKLLEESNLNYEWLTLFETTLSEARFCVMRPGLSPNFIDWPNLFSHFYPISFRNSLTATRLTDWTKAFNWLPPPLFVGTGYPKGSGGKAVYWLRFLKCYSFPTPWNRLEEKAERLRDNIHSFRKLIFSQAVLEIFSLHIRGGQQHWYVLSRIKVRPLNFCNILHVHRTIVPKVFGSQEGVLRL